MTPLSFLIKESARILLKKNYKQHSDLYRSIVLYKKTSSTIKKTPIRCIKDIIMLFKYWDAFPDTYFRFGMFLKEYSDKEKMKSFVPQGAYYRFSADKDIRYHILIDDKIIFHDIMTHYGLPVPTRYFTFRNGEFRNGSKLITDEEVDTIIESITDNLIFVKRFTGGAASGVSILTRNNDGAFIDAKGRKISASMIRRDYSGQDFFFEKQIIQEQVLNKFNSSTVNTIRVLTYKNKVISAAVRFGRKGSFVDNTAKGGIAVSLDIQTGILQSYGMREYDLNHYTEHPDSHLKFKDTYVAQWPEIKYIVEKTLKYLPYYQSVGFDIATTNAGPVIIEINTGAGIYLSQMGKEIGLRDYFNKL